MLIALLLVNVLLVLWVLFYRWPHSLMSLSCFDPAFLREHGTETLDTRHVAIMARLRTSDPYRDYLFLSDELSLASLSNSDGTHKCYLVES